MNAPKVKAGVHVFWVNPLSRQVQGVACDNLATALKVMREVPSQMDCAAFENGRIVATRTVKALDVEKELDEPVKA